MKADTEHQHEQAEPHVEGVEDMADASRRLIAHRALYGVCRELCRVGVGNRAVVSALLGIATAEIVAQAGRANAAVVLRDAAEQIEAGPVTLADIEAAGHG